MRILVTGAAGFIGSNFVRYWLEQHADEASEASSCLSTRPQTDSYTLPPTSPDQNRDQRFNAIHY